MSPPPPRVEYMDFLKSADTFQTFIARTDHDMKN